MPLDNTVADCSHSMELPEISELIAKYLPNHALARCVYVNKTWYSLYLPYLWETLYVSPDTINCNNGLNKDTVEKHCHLIRSISIANTTDFYGVISTCPNLLSMYITMDQYIDVYDQASYLLSEFLAMNPSITRLHLKSKGIDFDTLLKLPNLRHLSLKDFYYLSYTSFLRVQELCVDQLESLTISVVYIEKMPELRNTDNDMVLNSLKELAILDTMVFTPGGEMGIAKRCPNLETLRISKSTKDSDRITRQPREFVRLITNKTWPKLSSLSFEALSLSDHGTAKIMKPLDRCYKWATRGCRFGQESFEVLKGHFQTLTDIDLRMCPLAKSKMLQEILSSCPQLLCFRGVRINAEDIAGGNSWVCLSLRVFEAYLGFQNMVEIEMKKLKDTLYEGSTIEVLGLDPQKEILQRIVFERLSHLRYLRVLSIGHENDPWHPRKFRQGLDLRLDKGFEQLCRLRSIERFLMSKTVQLMREEEMYWILEHWRCLTTVTGTFHYQDMKKNFSVARILSSQGIKTLSLS
ncbi:hypothetical protein BGZ76_002882 [Entomortierella beljakovae]|nr:hypothetical protein BGZ76_002882 [Entomortierella beljakovae]